jgi:hypothetical protein
MMQKILDALHLTRSIHLDTEDWQRASWRPRVAKPRPDVKPFDRVEAIQRLKAIFAPLKNGKQVQTRYNIEWHRASISIALSPEEARFWFAAINYSFDNTDLGMQALVSFLDSVDLTQPLPLEEAIVTLLWSGRRTWKSPWIMLPISHFFDLETVLDRLVDLILLNDNELIDYIESRYGISQFLSDHGYNPAMPREYALPNIIQNFRPKINSTIADTVVPGFRYHICPYLAENEFLSLQTQVESILKRAPEHLKTILVSQNASHGFSQYQWIALLPAALGVDEPIRSIVAEWSTPFPNDQDIISQLRDPELVKHHTRRLNLRLLNINQVKAWLAHTEYSDLDWICHSVLQATNKSQAANLMEAFALVKSPETASYMLQLMKDSKAPELAREWLETHPRYAIAGLIPIVASKHKLTDQAISVLKALKQQGHGLLIEKALEQMEPNVATKLQAAVLGDDLDTAVDYTDETTPQWLRQALAPLYSKKAAPSWVPLTELPPLQIEQYCLNADQIKALLLALKQSGMESPHSVIAALKQHVQPTVLDAFVWRLFQLWLNEGGSSKEKWAMIALAHLGSDAIVFKLVPLIRQWPGESQHPRAVLGLECLRVMGTNTAIMQIHGLSQTLKHKALKRRAGECMQAIARDRQLAPEQLEDRIVPTLNLDRLPMFDFGVRQFQLAIGSELKPQVRDETGKLRADLPKPNAKDDADKAERAIADWKLLKKQMSEILRIQKLRLENALATERRWNCAEFESLLVQHPLMTHLAQRLIWGGFDAQGQLLETFRVAEDHTYSNDRDDALGLQTFTTVGMVHPLYLTPDQQANWGQILSDYEIIPPFAQMSREIFTVKPEELTHQHLQHPQFVNYPILAQRPGWHRNSPWDNYDGGGGWTCWKHFPRANITAIVSDQSDQTNLYGFMSGLEGKFSWFPGSSDHRWLRCDQVPPLIISEVLRDLHLMAFKSK